MGGAPVSEDIRQIISETWYILTSGGKKDIPVKEIIPKARERLIKRGLAPPKSNATYYKIISKLNDLTPEQRKLLDKLNKPWNLDNSTIAPDTIPYVLQLWRYSINLDEVFTIRQARWASKLCYVVKNLDIAEQWIHTLRYAKEEELSFLSGTPMRITQLNSLLIMGQSELFALRETDVKFKVNSKINTIYISYASDGGIIEEYLHAFSDAENAFLQFVWGDRTLENFERFDEIHNLIGSLPSSSKYFRDFESRMVYLRHLSALSKLPNWKTAKPKQLYDFVVDLRKWIMDETKPEEKPEPSKNKKSSRTSKPYLFTRDGKPIKLPKLLYSPSSDFDLFSNNIIRYPFDIYLRAGFSLEEDTNQLEKELNKKYKLNGEK